MSGSIKLYTDRNGEAQVDVIFENGEIWQSLAELARFFEVDMDTISGHIQYIYEEGEQEESLGSRDFQRIAENGEAYIEKQYNLSIILALGYRVDSARAKLFRFWSTRQIGKFDVKGFFNGL
jgi:hypothetical protein